MAVCAVVCLFPACPWFRQAGNLPPAVLACMRLPVPISSLHEKMHTSGVIRHRHGAVSCMLLTGVGWQWIALGCKESHVNSYLDCGIALHAHAARHAVALRAANAELTCKPWQHVVRLAGAHDVYGY
jgi:ribulose 1,5-bisphosphate carboxylase large subunit-like protein